MKRRDFLIGCSGALASTSLLPFPSFGFSEGNAQEIFVLIFLRGGCDALNLVAPVNDKNYIDARSSDLRITDSGAQKGLFLQNTLNNLDFALHKSAAPLLELYQSKQLGIVHACGLTNGTRSHFDAMDLIEKGIAKKQNTEGGWLARYLKQANISALIPAMGASNLPLSLLGSSQAISMNQPQDYDLKGDSKLKGILRTLYDDESLLSSAVQKTLKTIKIVQQKQQKNYQAAASYPKEYYAQNFVNSLKSIAQMIKMDLGLHIATADLSGWDTHEYQSWYFNELVKTLSESLMAFYNDLANYQQRLTVVVMSEFGRRLKGNKSYGTDHGYGGLMLALGKGIKGGLMYGKWNGLATEQLDNGVDLAVSTDYRTVLAEILSKKLGVSNLQSIFPDFKFANALGMVG